MEMSSKNANGNYAIVWLVRRLFRALAQKASEHLEPFGLTAADRAVMEFLYRDKTLSVPEIAARYQVSRQHVQVTANRLLESGMLESLVNPRHKRSRLLALTGRGRETFAAILGMDNEALRQLMSGIPERDRETTQKTLETLLGRLTEGG